MKDLTTKGLGAASGISKILNIRKSGKAQNADKIGTIQMTGVYAKGSYVQSVKQSNFVVPDEIISKYAGVETPKVKPTKLVIADADYMPDKEYADAEL